MTEWSSQTEFQSVASIVASKETLRILFPLSSTIRFSRLIRFLRRRFVTFQMVVPDSLTKLQKCVGRFQSKAWVPRRFELVGAEGDVDLLTRVTNVKPTYVFSNVPD